MRLRRQAALRGRVRRRGVTDTFASVNECNEVERQDRESLHVLVSTLELQQERRGWLLVVLAVRNQVGSLTPACTVYLRLNIYREDILWINPGGS